jgi:hypothetical protein
MSTESEALSTTNIKTATNIEVNLITDMLDWIKNSPQSIYALLGDYGMGKTFSCRILSAALTLPKPWKKLLCAFESAQCCRPPERIILTYKSPPCTVLGNTRINSVKNC